MMGIKLNSISDEIVRENLVYSINRFDEIMADPPLNPPISDSIRYFEVLGDKSFDIGLMLYQQETESDKIRLRFAQAADFLMRAYQLLKNPHPGAYFGPVDFEQKLALVACFNKALRPALSAIERWKYCLGTTEEEETIADYVDVLIAYLAKRQFNRSDCLRIITKCNLDNASRQLRKFLLPCAKAFMAAMEGNKEIWMSAIHEVLLDHEFEAKKGAYKRLCVGFICLPALTLAQLGMEQGMTCDVKSLYLPVSLLRKDPIE